ncbi:MAG: DUF2764 family protein [Desulfobacterales bacterium]|nr:DUF2764 family protein [Desulfobacterales bacterium]
MSSQPYYTLLASLPPLPRFDQTDRLPITRERLAQRLSMLAENDVQLYEHAADFLAWQRQSATRTDEEMITNFKKMEKHIALPTLQSIFDFPIDQRTIMAALRRRFRGLQAPAAGEPWGVGRYVNHIERNWDHPHFKLSAVYAWIPQARTYLEAGETLALERLLKNALWDHADRLIPPYEFGFRAVLIYIIKWDILDRWLSYDIEAAKVRFEELVTEVTDEQPKIFDG